MTNEELGKYLARELFKIGDGPKPCTRIQFMAGDCGNKTERGQGGCIESSLARCLTEILDKASAVNGP
jgi:hypothetical protein